MDNDNREQIYDERIYPLMEQIIDICKENNIPFVASFQLTTDEDEDGALMCTSCSLPDDAAKKLVEAKNVICGHSPIVLATITRETQPHA